MRVASLGSGSRGNATIVETARGDTVGEGRPGSAVLIDCGFSLKEAQRRAADRNFDLASLDAILVTHEHSDHASGVAALARHYGIPVYLTHGTYASGRLAGSYERVLINADDELRIGALQVQAVAVPHDAREPVQYRFEDGHHCVGVLTDLGSITEHVVRAFSDCDVLLLEFNHDQRMLAEGPYPLSLKRRVGGDWGHLSNTQAVALLEQVDAARLQCVVIAHISEKNNCRTLVDEALRKHVPTLQNRVRWASQEDGFDWLEPAAGAAFARPSDTGLDTGLNTRADTGFGKAPRGILGSTPVQETS